MALVAVLATTGVAVGASAGGVQAATVAPAATMTVMGPSGVAGSSINVEGTACISPAGATAVLLSLDTPSGEMVASTVANPYPSSYGTYQGDWYSSLAIPITALPSADYTVHASCRAQGQIFAYTPVTIAISAASSDVLAVSSSALSPGGSTTVSGAHCLAPAGSPVPMSVVATLIDDQSLPVDVAAVVPLSDGTWSASLTVPADAQPGIFLITAVCDQYNTGETYLAQSVSVQPPPASPLTTVTRYRGVTTAPAGTEVTLSASVRAGGVGVAGLPVTLSLGKTSVVAMTNTSGIARGMVTAPGAATTKVSATFAGNSGFAASATGAVPFTDTGALSATKLVFRGVRTVDQYSPAPLSAKLTDSGGVAVVGRAVTFATPQGTLEAAPTDSAGIATIETSLGALGINQVALTYNGDADATYASSSAAGKVTVTAAFVPGGMACASALKCTIVGSNGEMRRTTDGGQTWVQVTPVTSATLNSVTCPSSTVCIAVGAAGTVLTSANGGAGWTLQPAITAQSLSAVKCKGLTDCVTVGSAGVVFTSTTHGAAWTAGVSGTALDFDALSCPTTTACLATANGPSGSATLASTDAGAHWSVVDASEPSGPVTGQDQLDCTSATRCLISSQYGLLFRTVDGGVAWSSTNGPYGASIHCKSATSCLAVGSYGQTGTSTDGGATWTTTYPFSYYGYAQDLVCTTSQCTAVFRSAFAADASTYSSTDGGTTWNGPVGL